MIGRYDIDYSQLPPAPKGKQYVVFPGEVMPSLVPVPQQSSPLSGLLILGGAIALLAWGWNASRSRAVLPVVQMNPFRRRR